MERFCCTAAVHIDELCHKSHANHMLVHVVQREQEEWLAFPHSVLWQGFDGENELFSHFIEWQQSRRNQTFSIIRDCKLWNSTVRIQYFLCLLLKSEKLFKSNYTYFGLHILKPMAAFFFFWDKKEGGHLSIVTALSLYLLSHKWKRPWYGCLNCKCKHHEGHIMWNLRSCFKVLLIEFGCSFEVWRGLEKDEVPVTS